ncbi:hypothetical protein M9H77_29635 [Catharanthus roseus]|uniref:Uncharacterized protein n=1 Tax=Catharanthus roseus TaxID=4058 RepID=A0ACB9ZZ79_CATRO|nr:hypothetical protein M9H77_29635 [Catharanthus roseus]
MSYVPKIISRLEVVIDANIIFPLVNHLEHALFEIKKEDTVHIMKSHEVMHSEESSASYGKRARISVAWDVFEILPIDSHGKGNARCRVYRKVLSADLCARTTSLKCHALKCANVGEEIHKQYPIVDHNMYRIVMA